MPLLTIITPSFNSAKTIERTIKSILDQEFLDYEYLIIDGASKDNTLDIVKKYHSSFDGKMKWYSEPDKGIYDAFNKGIRLAKGEYVWIVNSDDYMEPNALSVLGNYICSQKTKPEVISAAMNFINMQGEISRVAKSNQKQADYCYKTNGMGVTHPATIVAKSVYSQYGLYDDEFKICGDIDWFFRIYKSGVKICFIDDIVTNMTEGGVSTTFNLKKMAKDRRRLLKKRYHNFLLEAYYFVRWAKRVYFLMRKNKL